MFSSVEYCSSESPERKECSVEETGKTWKLGAATSTHLIVLAMSASRPNDAFRGLGLPRAGGHARQRIRAAAAESGARRRPRPCILSTPGFTLRLSGHEFDAKRFREK